MSFRYFKSLSLLLLVVTLLLGSTIVLRAQIPHSEWVRGVGERVYNDIGRAVAIDAAGNVYVTGQYITKLTIGKAKLKNMDGDLNNTDIFVAKYNTHGVAQWAKRIHGRSNDYANGIAVDASGNAFVTGYFSSSSLTSGTSTITGAGSQDMFVAKFDPNGNTLWLRGAGGAALDTAFAVTIDNSGNAYVVGSYQSTSITFGSTTLVNTGKIDPFGNRYSDIFMVKYNPTGTVVWAQAYGDSSHEEARDIKVDASGNIYLTGTFASDSIMIDTCKIKSAGGVHPAGIAYADIFVAKLTPTLQALWAKRAGFLAADVPYGLGFDNSFNVYVAGSFESDSIRFDSTTAFVNNGYKDVLLLKYDANGEFQWARQAGGMYSDEAVTLAVDGAGNSYIGGYYESPSLTFGSTTLVNSSSPESKIFLAKYNTSGNVVWAKSDASTSGVAHVYELSIDGTGALLVTGSFTGKNMAFEDLTILNSNQSFGWDDVFLVKLFEATATGSTMFRTLSQTDLNTAALKAPKFDPTFGNARDTTFLRAYPSIASKNDPNYPGGLVLGIARSDSAKVYGWLRFTLKGKTVEDFLVQTGTARGYDLLGTKPFIKELKNPKTTKYNNRLAGNLAALKLNMAASRFHVTQEGFCDLVFNHPSYPSHIFNGKSIYQISKLADTMLTYYKKFYSSTPTPLYDSVANWIDTLNYAFQGPLGFVTKSPIRLSGVKQLGDVNYLEMPVLATNVFSVYGHSSSNSTIEETYSLKQNYPNPFNPTTTISYSLPFTSTVTMKIYDVAGREVATLLNQATMDQGDYEMTFDGSMLASGMYFYKISGTNLSTGTTFSDVKKMLLVK